MASKVNSAKLSNVNACIKLFYFFSCLVALERTDRLGRADLEETMRLVLPGVSGEYAQRSLLGVY
jgi:hypothetical protein